MKLAVLLLSCTGTTRVTDFDRAWVHRLVGHVAGYYLDQSGGRVNIEFRVFDWFQLPHSSQQWNDLGFGAGPVVRPIVEKGLNIDLSSYEYFALVIDKMDASGAAVSPLHPNYVHIGAQEFTPALLQHEMGHFFGAGHANLDTPSGPAVYDDRFCIMGREGAKFSFVYKPLNRLKPNGARDATLSTSGPGMAASTLRACGWLDLKRNGIDISTALKSGSRRSTITLVPLRGGPALGSESLVCAFADDVVPGQRLLLEYRSRDNWDQGMPQPGVGWVVAHTTGREERSRTSLQIGAIAAIPGKTTVTTKGAVQLTVVAASASSVTLTVEVLTAISVTSWGPDRLDIFGLGRDHGVWHKAWAHGWHPSQNDWESLGGQFISPPVVSSWGPKRLDIFGVGIDKTILHKAWSQGWYPSPNDWESLGGQFISSPAVVSWGVDRLDIFGIGLNGAMYHKAWAEGWYPSPNDWEPLGGGFVSSPVVSSWGVDRLDIFAIGLDGGMWHKAWAKQWFPSQDGWESLGGKFLGPPAVVSWGPGRIDIFGIGLDGAMYHKAWAEGWYPSQDGWESLGGKFLGPPAVVSWGTDRLDIFGIGVDGAMYHKAWAKGWVPSDGWELLGGAFTSPPSVVSWGVDRLDILGLGEDFGMWHKAWAQQWHPSLPGWESLGGGFI